MSIIQGESKADVPFTNPPNLTTNPIQGEPKNQTPFTTPVVVGSGPPGTIQPSTFASIAAAAQNQAQNEINSELSAQIDPLNRSISATRSAETSALGQIGSMFDQLQPIVQGSAEDVAASYQGAEAMQAQIFQQATQRMNDMKQARAQEAQRLAQQMGGPVAIDEWTAGWDPATTSLINMGAGSQLQTLGYAQAGVQAAQTFAGQVFPLIRTEQTANARSLFESQVKDLQGKIDDLNSQRSSMINTRQHDLMQQQLQYKLDVAKQNLDALNSQRNWQQTKKQYALDAKNADRDYRQKQAQLTLDRNKFRADKKTSAATLAIEKAKLGISQKEANIQEAAYTGKYGGKPTLQAVGQAAQIAHQKRADANAAKAMNVSVQRAADARTAAERSYKLAQTKMKMTQRDEAAQWLDAAFDPKPGRQIKQSSYVPIDASTAQAAAIRGDKSIYHQKGGPWYRLTTTYTDPGVTHAITDPNQLVDYLTGHGVAKALAITLVQKRLSIPNWKYGVPYTGGSGAAGEGNIWNVQGRSTG